MITTCDFHRTGGYGDCGVAECTHNRGVQIAGGGGGKSVTGEAGGGGGAGSWSPSSELQRRACERALPALVVAEAAFKAAWGPTLVALNSTPHSADADAAVVLMFEVERALKRIAETLRGKQ